METKWIRAKNGRMVKRTYVTKGEHLAITVAIGLCFILSLFLVFIK